jgi:glycosyltransferase involved in cell wall biosynthesis
MKISQGKINLMHVVLSLEVGGLEKLVVEHAMSINRDIFNVEVCCCDRLGLLSETLHQNGIPVTLLQKNLEHFDYAYPLRLRRFLQEKNVHILHMHSGAFFLGTMGALLARTPATVYTDHGRLLVDPTILILMERFAGRFVDKIIAVSNELESYLKQVVKVPAAKTTTIINGIDTTIYRYRPKPLRLLEEFNIPANSRIIGTVGRLAAVKDQMSMIEAFAIVHEKMPDTVLLLVGDGPMRNELDAAVERLNLNGSVLFTGNRMDVSHILNLFDVFVLTSLSEGTSISLLEAMSSGVAPLVTDVGGNPSIVESTVDGILVHPKDLKDISEKIIVLLKDDAMRSRIAKNAANKIRLHYGKDAMMVTYQNMYLELIGPRGVLYTS